MACLKASGCVTVLLLCCCICRADVVADLEVERCLALHLRQVVSGCSIDDTSSTALPPRDALTKLLRTCFGSDYAANQGNRTSLPARLLVPDGAFVPLVSRAASLYQAVTGVPVVLVTVPYSRATSARVASTTNARNLSATHEVWLVTPTSIGDGIALGAYKDITDLVRLDKRLHWQGLVPSMRVSGLTYKSRVVGLPLSAYSSLLYYRKDVFTRNNLTVPRTWREMLSAAVKYNGTEGMWAYCGGWNPCTQGGTGILRSMFSSYTQTLGGTHGWLMDPDSMNLLIDSPAMEDTIKIARGLFKVSPPEPPASEGCWPGSVVFRQRKCLMTVDQPTTFKFVSHSSRAKAMAGVQGNVGIALLPGTDQVLDRATNTLVQCDETRCPYADQYATDTGTLHVNRAPGFDANLMPTNAQSPPDLGYYAFSVISYITSPEVMDTMVFDSDAEIYPSRTSQYNPQRWAAAGFNLNDSIEYTSAQYTALNHPNLNVHIRIPGASQIVTLLGEIANNITFTNLTAQQIMATGQSKARLILNNMYKGNATALMLEYWASLNRQLRTDPIQPPVPVPAPATAVEVNNNGNNEPSMLPLILVLCITVPMATALLLAILWWRHRASAKAWRAWQPCAGPLTTLVVTDIENSTDLWDMLDAVVLDSAYRVHNGCIRNLAAAHRGYESNWEGDSFILAFPTPTDAVQFALDAQTTLLQQNWPAQLLQCDATSEHWMQPVQAVVEPRSPSKSEFSGRVVASSQHSRQTPVLGADWGEAEPLADVHHTPSVLQECDAMRASYETLGASSGPLVKCNNAKRYSWGEYFKSSWQTCPSSVSGAVLVWRGLRVRIGIHAGVHNDKDCTYSESMKRYHFTGPARVLCNAVASAGHGGQVMTTASTLSLLLSADQGLPAEARIYHMGHHLLKGIDGDAVELLLLLPKSLRCRMAAQQNSLRSERCILPGVLQTPMLGMGNEPALVYVQMSGVPTLLAWNRDITVDALLMAYSSCMSPLSECGGMIHEHHMVTKQQAQQRSTAPGCIVFAFANAEAALRFAITWRSDLLALNWSEDLIVHELCEPVEVGNLRPMFDSSTHASSAVGSSFSSAGEETSLEPGSARAILSESGAVPRVSSPRACATSHNLRTSTRQGRLSFGGGTIHPSGCSAHALDGIENQSDHSHFHSSSTLGPSNNTTLGPNNSSTTKPASQRSRLSSQFHKPSASNATREPAMLSTRFSPRFSELFSNTGPPSSQHIRSASMLLATASERARLSCNGSNAFPAGGPHASPNDEEELDPGSGRSSLGALMGPALDGARSQGGRTNSRSIKMRPRILMPEDAVLEAPMLRGLRPRMLITNCGKGGFQVLTRTTGRVVYTDRTIKAVAAQITSVRPGQIKVQKELLPLVVPARIAAQTTPSSDLVVLQNNVHMQ